MLTRFLLTTTAILTVSANAAYAGGTVRGVAQDGSPQPAAMQTGNLNSADIEQTNVFDAVAELGQYGNSNGVTLRQSSVSNSGMALFGTEAKISVLHIGDGNNANLGQFAQHDSSIVASQIGANNTVSAQQGVSSDTASVGHAYQFIVSKQNGDGNSADIFQTGGSNIAQSEQHDSGNTTSISQTNIGLAWGANSPNFAGINLSGAGNFASVTQNGSGNDAGISAAQGFPTFPGNSVNSGNRFLIEQNGHSNTALLFPGVRFGLRDSSFVSTQNGNDNSISGISTFRTEPVTMDGESNSINIQVYGDRNTVQAGSSGINNVGTVSITGSENHAYNAQGNERDPATNSTGTITITGHRNDAGILQTSNIFNALNEATIMQSGDGNRAYITQDGASDTFGNQIGSHVATVSQTGSEHYADVQVGGTRFYSGDSNVNIIQTAGWHNRAQVAMFGGRNDAQVAQFGNSNRAKVLIGDKPGLQSTSSGLDNRMSVTQTGNNNTGGVALVGGTQPVPGGTLTKNPYSNVFALEQVGNNNVAITDPAVTAGNPDFAEAILIDGNENDLAVRQSGNDNVADIQLEGDRHIGFLHMNGNENRAKLYQEGIGNNAGIVIDGDLNEASIMQLGIGNEASIRQQGNSNIAAIEQFGDGNRATIEQTGLGNSVKIVQK